MTAYEDLVETTDAGQLVIGVDGDQRTLDGFGFDAPKPAPVPHDEVVERVRDEVDTLAAAATVRVVDIEDRLAEAEAEIAALDAGTHPALTREAVLTMTAEEVEEGLIRRRTPQRREYHCADCGRKLPHERWIYSRHTGARYCTPGEGCNTPEAYARRERERAQARKEA
jgi:hypothetical protein